MDLICNLGQIRNFCSAMLWWPFWFIIVRFGLFLSWVTPPPLHGRFWLLSPFKWLFNPEMDPLVTENEFKALACACCGDHLDQFWSILVHFGAPHGCPHHPSMTGSDSYPLSSVHLIQKWIILVIEDKFEKLFLGHAIVTILVHFGQFWCTSWVTPRPLFIEFPSSHQRYVSYA